MNSHKLFAVIVANLIALVMILAVSLALNPTHAATAAPQSASVFQQYALLVDTAITQTDTGLARLTGPYSQADCYAVTSGLTSPQTVTVALDHSADASNWVNLYTYAAVSTNTIAFTRTLLYGEYLRASATLAGSTAVTVTVRCVAK